MPSLLSEFLAPPSPLLVIDFTPYSSRLPEVLKAVKTLFFSQAADLSTMPLNIVLSLYYASIHSARITEILNLTPADYLGNSRFLAHGLKRSRDYVVHIPIIELEPLVPADPRMRIPLFTCSYDQIWRACRRCGLGTLEKHHKYFKRTHAHRYYTARQIAGAANQKSAGDVLHHNSKASIVFYTQQKEVSHGTAT